jgi:hypothetical protein
MSNQLNSNKDQAESEMVYEIRVRGHMDRQWANWFNGMSITLEENGDTLLTGPVIDQAALHGLLRRIRDLGMPLLALTCIENDEGDDDGSVSVRNQT